MIALLGELVLVAGCAAEQETQRVGRRNVSFTYNYSAFQEWVQNNPCGALAIRRPLFNVTGYLPAANNESTMLLLFIARNVSEEGTRYAVENCAPLTRIPVQVNGGFILPSLPQGNYVVAARKDPRSGHSDFPVIIEYSQSNYSVEHALDGETSRYMWSAFSIRPVEHLEE